MANLLLHLRLQAGMTLAALQSFNETLRLEFEMSSSITGTSKCLGTKPWGNWIIFGWFLRGRPGKRGLYHLHWGKSILPVLTGTIFCVVFVFVRMCFGQNASQKEGFKVCLCIYFDVSLPDSCIRNDWCPCLFLLPA